MRKSVASGRALFRIESSVINVDNGVEVKCGMTFPVIVHHCQGQFEATLVGAPQVRVTASTREGALTALETAIAKRLEEGELVALEVGRRGLTGLFGRFRDDPTLREICEEAYHERDHAGSP